jgi:hypothetical protein
MHLSRDMDVLGEKWWDYVPDEIAHKYTLINRLIII